MPDLLFFIDDIERVCTTYCLRFWEVVGIWLTGIATSSAVIVSLMFSRRDRPKIKVSAGIRIIIGGEATDNLFEDYPQYLAIAIRNVGNRPVKIEGIGWHKLKPFNLHAYQTVPPQPGGITLPYTLPEGDSVSLYMALDDPDVEWGPEFAKNFVGRWPKISVRFIRVTAWNPIGDTFRDILRRVFVIA